MTCGCPGDRAGFENKTWNVGPGLVRHRDIFEDSSDFGDARSSSTIMDPAVCIREVPRRSRHARLRATWLMTPPNIGREMEHHIGRTYTASWDYCDRRQHLTV